MQEHPSAWGLTEPERGRALPGLHLDVPFPSEQAAEGAEPQAQSHWQIVFRTGILTQAS